jgi:hypothetical protein
MLVFPPGVAASYRRGEQAAGIGELAPEIGRGNAMALGQCREPVEPAGVEYVGADGKRAGPRCRSVAKAWSMSPSVLALIPYAARR